MRLKDGCNITDGEEAQLSTRHQSGSIAVSIAIMKEDGSGKKRDDPKKCSEIVIDRPFPHDPNLFLNWTDFFERCIDAECSAETRQRQQNMSDSCCGGEDSQTLRRTHENDAAPTGCLARPCLNVEYKGRVSVETLKSLCPFIIREASFPSLEPGQKSTWLTHLFSPRTGYVETLDALETDDSLHVNDAISFCHPRSPRRLR